MYRPVFSQMDSMLGDELNRKLSCPGAPSM